MFPPIQPCSTSHSEENPSDPLAIVIPQAVPPENAVALHVFEAANIGPLPWPTMAKLKKNDRKGDPSVIKQFAMENGHGKN